MQEELLIIAKLMNDFTKKYDYKIAVETFESRFVDDKEAEIIYRLKAVELETTKLEVIS